MGGQSLLIGRSEPPGAGTAGIGPGPRACRAVYDHQTTTERLIVLHARQRLPLLLAGAVAVLTLGACTAEPAAKQGDRTVPRANHR